MIKVNFRSVLCKIFRICNVLFGTFIISGYSLYLLGLFPYSEISERIPSLNKTIMLFQYIFFGILLVVPYTKIKIKSLSLVMFILLGISSIYFIYRTIPNINNVVKDNTDIIIIPVFIMTSTLILGNIWAYCNIVFGKKVSTSNDNIIFKQNTNF